MPGSAAPIPFVRTQTKKATGWVLVELPGWCFPKEHDGIRWVIVGA